MGQIGAIFTLWKEDFKALKRWALKADFKEEGSLALDCKNAIKYDTFKNSNGFLYFQAGQVDIL